MRKISFFFYSEYAEFMKEAGFDTVMIGWRDDDRLECLEKARNAGFYVENIHAASKNLECIWIDNQNGDNYMECLLTSVKDCEEYNIPTMVVHLNNGSMPPLSSNVGIDRLKRIIEKAESANVKIALENTCSSDCIRFVFDSIPSKNLGFCFDSGHQNLNSSGRDLLEEHGERLMAMHLNDNYGTGDLHLLPFDGNIDWNKTTRQLKKINYGGAIAFEVGIYKDWQPKKFFETAFDKVKMLLRMLNGENDFH